MKKLILIFLFLLIPSLSWGTTYYMRGDGTAANKAAGTGPCATQANCMSIATHDAQTFSAGDVIILCDDGGIYRDQLDIPSSGSVGNPITYQAESGGSPKIYGSTQVSTWTDEGGNLWYASNASDPNSVWFVNTNATITWGREETLKASLTAEYEWWWDSGNTRIYVYAITDPDSRYSSIEIPTRYRGIYGNGKDYITINGIDIAFSLPVDSDGYGGIHLLNCDNAIVKYCISHHNGVASADPHGDGIYIESSNNPTIQYNTTYFNARRGISVFDKDAGAADNLVVEHNTTYNNYHSQIDIQILVNGVSLDNPIIRYNHIYLNSDITQAYTTLPSMCGIFLAGPGAASALRVTNAQIYNNFIYNTYNNPAISLDRKVNGCEIYNNTFYGFTAGSATTTGLYINGSSLVTNVTVKNNIGTQTYAAMLSVTDSNAIIACDNNLWWKDNDSSPWVTVTGKANSPYFSTEFALYKSETGWDTNGKWEDPLFANAGSNFHLQSSSPAKDTGATIASVTDDYDGISRPQGPAYDMGAYEYVSRVIITD